MILVNRAKLQFFLFSQTKSRIFSVRFLKQDFTMRTMICRFGVQKDLKGKSPGPEWDKPYLRVFDMQKQAYRMINLETILYGRANGKDFQVVSSIT